MGTWDGPHGRPGAGPVPGDGASSGVRPPHGTPPPHRTPTWPRTSVCETATMTSEMITAAAAGAWRLGDLDVNRIGFGAMRLTGSAAFHLGTPSDRDRSIAVLRRAIELGVDHIDTAAFYFSSLRSANELINSALAPYADELVIVTKVGPYRDYAGSGAPRQAGPTAFPRRGEPAPARARPPRRGEPAADGAGLDRRALRRARRTARRGADPAPRSLRRRTPAPGRGTGHRARRVRAEPVRPRLHGSRDGRAAADLRGLGHRVRALLRDRRHGRCAGPRRHGRFGR